MQFGRTFGFALMVLGLILCTLQLMWYGVPLRKPSNAAPTVSTELHVTSSLPGIVGAGSLVIGIALFVTARRRDEPNPKYKVK